MNNHFYRFGIIAHYAYLYMSDSFVLSYVYIQIEEMVIQEFSATNTTVLPPSRFSTGQDINSIPVCEYNLYK